MATSLRIATFNCENLFSRPKVFETTAAKSQKILKDVAELEAELRRDPFDKKKIKSLQTSLKGFATINEVRGHLSSQSVKGPKDFLGWVELTRSENTDAAVENTARVIAEVDADIICLMEVESRIELQKFHDGLLFTKFLQPAGKAFYENILLIDGNDDRGIDVAVMSRLPVLSLRSHINEPPGHHGNDGATFSRDCLEVRVQLPNKKELLVMVNHLKSKRSSPGDPQSNLRRERQARRVAELVDEHDLKKEFLVVAGDLNDTPDSKPLKPLLTKKGLFNVNLKLAVADRFTFRSPKEQIDYLLVSDALKAKLTKVRVERQGIFSSQFPHFPTVTSRRTEASDHGAVVADFQF
ncbi:MAG TPA: endonuclease/exonuclease/phosphatase family protein [Blastocatellia bacterium]|nr:endonuclease/exonuclease/phosphatase family protein [Blastocatellia bacterium]